MGLTHRKFVFVPALRLFAAALFLLVSSTCLAGFLTIHPYIPSRFLELAKERIPLTDKMSLLRRLIQSFPLDAKVSTAREDLIELLSGSNRYEEALQEYLAQKTQRGGPDGPDFVLLDYFLKTGRYGDILRQTSASPVLLRDFIRDKRLMEFRVQALLAQGKYRMARHAVERWLTVYAGDGIPGSRFESDVRAVQFLERHLCTLERVQGTMGKALFTASVPDSLKRWSHRQNVPVVFFKLIPAHPAGQLYEAVLPGRHEGPEYFEKQVTELNRGFRYLSRGQFSVTLKSLYTLYVKEGDLDPTAAGGHLLTSRVYVHTIPPLYKLAGQAFVILVDYRVRADGEAAYMGDGLIHVSANKLQTMVLMHEILHGLGATHKEWENLEAKGYQFDPDDRGLMTFEKGELRDLGLEEKNRSLLGWPHVAVIHFPGDTAAVPALNLPPSS